MKISFGHFSKGGGAAFVTTYHLRVIQFGYIERKCLDVFIYAKSILGFRHCLFWRNVALKILCGEIPFFFLFFVM